MTAGLIVFWPNNSSAPPTAVGTARRPGTWCLTADGATAIGLDAPLFRTAWSDAS